MSSHIPPEKDKDNHRWWFCVPQAALRLLPEIPADPHSWRPHNNTVRQAAQCSTHVPRSFLPYSPLHRRRGFPAFPEDTAPPSHSRRRLPVFSRKLRLCSGRVRLIHILYYRSDMYILSLLFHKDQTPPQEEFPPPDTPAPSTAVSPVFLHLYMYIREKTGCNLRPRTWFCKPTLCYVSRTAPDDPSEEHGKLCPPCCPPR